MPRFGTLDLSGWNKSAPSLSGYKTEPLVLKGAQILSINIEIDDEAWAIFLAILAPAAEKLADASSHGHTPHG